MKYALYGIGRNAKVFLNYNGLYSKDYIVGLFDSDEKKTGTSVMGRDINSPELIHEEEFDYIIVCPNDGDEIVASLLHDFRVPANKILKLKDYYKKLSEHLASKYANNKEILDIIFSFMDYEPNIYGSYLKRNPDKYKVYFDKDNDPYILFEGKRMYYPRGYDLLESCNGELFVRDVLYEQGVSSPHLYIKDDGMRRKLNGGVIVDAGVCEGNFSLRYVEKAKRIYLIEADERWCRALEKTFRPYREKVIIVEKYLSRSSDRKHITIDELVKEQIDFLKMDIEGYEIDALLGAKNTLKNSNCDMSICSYHRANDEENIRFILESLGFTTSTSDGYMLFMHDPYFCDTLDFRRGVVYGRKD